MPVFRNTGILRYGNGLGGMRGNPRSFCSGGSSRVDLKKVFALTAGVVKSVYNPRPIGRWSSVGRGPIRPDVLLRCFFRHLGRDIKLATQVTVDLGC